MFEVIALSHEQSVNKPDVNHRWENTYGGVRVSGTLNNDGVNTVKNTFVRVNVTSENGETDYDWVEVSENIPTGGCVRFCETVFTHLHNISDVYCKVSTYD